MAINANSFGALGAALKLNYLPYSNKLVQADYAFYGMCKEKTNFTKKGGGQNLVWELVTDRAMNAQAGSEDGFLPGFSASTNDDIRRVSTIEASLPRGYLYADAAFTSHQMADVHKSFENFRGWGFAEHIKGAQDDFGMMAERHLLNDKTGILGIVSSVATPGNTVLTMQPASTIGLRGIFGTQRVYVNQRVAIIKAADWATNPRTARIHSNIGNSGTAFQLVVATSGIHDVGAAPTITLSGDLTTAGTAVAAGDIIVEANSRAVNATGGNAASEALAALTCFDGLFSFIDDGTLTSTLYNQSRTTYPTLNSQVNLSASVRPASWTLFQVLFDKLKRRRGNLSREKLDQGEYAIFAEQSVRTAYVAQPGEAQKEYNQEGRALKLVQGFSDVSIVMMGNDRPVPFVSYNTIPYGHALVMRPAALHVMWDIPPGVLDENGLTLHKQNGKSVWTWEYQAVGNFMQEDPWFDGRISGLQGQFS